MTATSTATATISPVNTSKSILYFLGNSTAPNSDFVNPINRMAYLTLTDSTTITASGAPTSTSSGMAVSWQLVEYY